MDSLVVFRSCGEKGETFEIFQQRMPPWNIYEVTLLVLR